MTYNGKSFTLDRNTKLQGNNQRPDELRNRALGQFSQHISSNKYNSAIDNNIDNSRKFHKVQQNYNAQVRVAPAHGMYTHNQNSLQVPNGPSKLNSAISSTSLGADNGVRKDIASGADGSAVNYIEKIFTAAAVKRPTLKPMVFNPKTASGTRKTHRRIQSCPGKTDIFVKDGLQQLEQLKGYVEIDGQRHEITRKCLTNGTLIGQGSCGEVYKMTLVLPTLTKTVAVKQMLKSGNKEELKRVLQDMQVYHKCTSCEYIVQWYGVLAEEEHIWILMEYCEFGDFTRIIKKVQQSKIVIPEFLMVEFCKNVVHALDYLKSVHSIIHRDIRPSNVLVDGQGQIKLCDFSISGNLQNSIAYSKAAGVAGYLAPERIEGSASGSNEGYDVRSDVFSLGLTIYEVATGRYAYDSYHSTIAVAMAIQKGPSPKLPEIGNWSENFKKFLNLCLLKNVDERPKYTFLKNHPFISQSPTNQKNIKIWLNNLFDGKLNLSDVSPSSNTHTSILKKNGNIPQATSHTGINAFGSTLAVETVNLGLASMSVSQHSNSSNCSAPSLAPSISQSSMASIPQGQWKTFDDE